MTAGSGLVHEEMHSWEYTKSRRAVRNDPALGESSGSAEDDAAEISNSGGKSQVPLADDAGTLRDRGRLCGAKDWRDASRRSIYDAAESGARALLTISRGQRTRPSSCSKAKYGSMAAQAGMRSTSPRPPGRKTRA